MTDIAKIAARLSKAQREYVTEGPHTHWSQTHRALHRRGLTWGGQLTPLGLAVRAHLLAQEQDDAQG